MLGNKLNTECDLCSTPLGSVLVKTQCFDKTPLCVFKVCLVYVLRLKHMFYSVLSSFLSFLKDNISTFSVSRM